MFDSNVTTSDIFIYVFLALGVLGIIGALFWTKLIKPVKLSYSSSSYLTKNKIDKAILNLLEKKIVQDYYKKAIFKVANIEAQAVTRVVLGYKNVYFVANPMDLNVLKAKKVKNEYMVEIKDKKDDYLLAPDLILFIKGAKFLKQKFLNNKQAIVIIPGLNYQFEDTKIDNIDFVKLDNLNKLIIDLEKETIENLSMEKLAKLNEILLKNRKRNTKIFK